VLPSPSQQQRKLLQHSISDVQLLTVPALQLPQLLLLLLQRRLPSLLVACS
jgi:hypothetical protein